MKKFLAVILSLITVILVCAGCGSSDNSKTTDQTSGEAKSESVKLDADYDYIVDKGELVVGITNYAPMDYKEDGEWTGFDAEFGRAVAKKMGVKITFKEINWDNKFFELNSKAIDCIWNGMTISTEVKNNTSCSKAYAKNNQVVVMAADKADSYKKAEDLKDLSFAVESGSAGQTAAEDNSLEYTPVGAQSDALTEVASGSVDACIIDKTMAEAMTGEGTSYNDLATSIILTDEEYGVGFRKNSDMTEKFNAYIDELKEDGTLEKLADKYKVTLAD